MKVLICLSLCVAATVALHLPRDHHHEDDHDATFPRPVPPNWQPPHRPDVPEMNPEFRELMRDVRDFVKLLPHREIRRLLKDAFRHDEEFRATIRYLRSPQFMHVMKEVGELPEVKELIHYVMEQHFEGQDIAMRALTAFEDEIEMEAPVEPQTTVTGGLCGLIARVMTILPTEALQELHREKVSNGGVFAKIVRIVTSEEYAQRRNAVLESERFIEIDSALRERGVCFDKIGKLIITILGYH